MRKRSVPKRIVTMNVCAARFRDKKHNPPRIQFALKILELAQQNHISCVCFPSGYLFVSKENQIVPILSPIIRSAKNLGISVVIGVDLTVIHRLPDSPDAPEFLDIVKRQKLPCFLAAFNNETGKTVITRQRTGTGFHYRSHLVPDDIMLTPRVMRLGECEFQIVGCGELYDRRIFSEGVPKVAIDFGHKTMPRLGRSLRGRSKQGFAILNTEHRTGRGGILFCYDRGKNKSVRDCVNLEWDDELWADIAAWELNDKGRVKPVPFRIPDVE